MSSVIRFAKRCPLNFSISPGVPLIRLVFQRKLYRSLGLHSAQVERSVKIKIVIRYFTKTVDGKKYTHIPRRFLGDTNLPGKTYLSGNNFVAERYLARERLVSKQKFARFH